MQHCKSIMPIFFARLDSKKEKKKIDGCDVVIGVNYGVASFLSWSKYIWTPETCIPKMRGPQQLLPHFKGETLKQSSTSLPAGIYLPPRAAPRFPHG